MKLLQGPLNWRKEVGSERDGEVEMVRGTSALIAACLTGEKRHPPWAPDTDLASKNNWALL